MTDKAISREIFSGIAGKLAFKCYIEGDSSLVYVTPSKIDDFTAVLQTRTPKSVAFNMRACSMPLETKRHASKKASGTAKNGRDSNAKYLGVKLYGKYVHETKLVHHESLSEIDVPVQYIVLLTWFIYLCSMPVKAGGIIIRQRGLKFQPGENVSFGRDHTLYAKHAGVVQFL